MRFANRMETLPAYHFAEANIKIAAKRASGIDVISLAMGDPDLPAPSAVVEKLRETALDPANHRYPDYFGLAQLRQAMALWYWQRFHVELDPEKEVLPLIGSKEGLAHLSLAVLDPGDVALIPDPAYGVYETGALLAGGIPYHVALTEATGFLPDLEAIPADTVRRAKVLWLNYPNNPTGATAQPEFFREAVDYAHKHQLLLCHDIAYSDITYDEYRPSSILEISGAREVAIEFHSFSKTFNMAGWRLGMVMGNAQVINALGRLKTHLDTGIFNPLQWSALEALNLPSSWIAERNLIYKRRRDLLLETCAKLGLRTFPTKAGLYVWAAVPAGTTSRNFSLKLLDEAAVFVTPGVNFGPHGEGYIRIAFTIPDARLREAVERLQRVAVG